MKRPPFGLRQLIAATAPILRGACLPMLGLLVWLLASGSGWRHGSTWTSPGAVWTWACSLVANGELARALGATLGRYAAGTAAGVLAGLWAGLALGLSRHVRLLFGPTFHTLKQISLFAWVPLIMAWFGLNESSKIVFIALAGFFPVLLGTLEGVGGVARDLVEVAAVCRLTRRQLLRKVVLPAALPSIFTGVHLALIYAWLATLGAEYLMTSGPGLGALLIEGQEQFRLDIVLLGIVAVAVVGLALAGIASWLERRMLYWKSVGADASI